MGRNDDTEITLGTGRLLVLFFGLVVICAIFFSLGYTLGKNNAPRPSLVTDASAATPASTDKPAAGTPCPAGQDCSSGAPPADELTFYKSVEQKDPTAQLNTPAPSAPAPAAKPQAAQTAAAKPAPEMATAPMGTGYTVQVAAVSKQQDAEALVDALHKKQYPAFIADNAGDKLFHVQVGPFAKLDDADAMKQRLLNDGYNPMVKR